MGCAGRVRVIGSCAGLRAHANIAGTMRVLVLTSSTGGGHDMRARSFKAWAEHPSARELGLEVTLHQALENTHPVYDFGVGIYNWIQRVWPALHHVYFNVLEWVPFCGSKGILGRAAFMERVRELKPDVILSTHDHLNHGFFEAAREALAPAPVRCATYCGELFGGYGFSHHWVNPACDLFIGAVEECAETARRFGVPAGRARVGGFLLNPNFYEPVSPEARRRFLVEELRLEPDRFTLVLATGANGANNHLPLLQKLHDAGVMPQVVCLCGKDAAAYAAVDAWAKAHPKLPARPLGYTTRMNEVMAAASAIVARPGTGTTSEAILSTTPIIFNGLGGIMPQEWITVKFSRAHGLGAVMKRPGQLPRLVKAWMESPGALEAQREAMRKALPQGHPLEILRTVKALAENAVPAETVTR